jgi:hypothetical protein
MKCQTRPANFDNNFWGGCKGTLGGRKRRRHDRHVMNIAFGHIVYWFWFESATVSVGGDSVGKG